jgi:hypothetical protein
LRCLFCGDCWIEFFAVCGLRTEGCGGENALFGFVAGDIDQDGLVFEEGGHEEETGNGRVRFCNVAQHCKRELILVKWV